MAFRNGIATTFVVISLGACGGDESASTPFSSGVDPTKVGTKTTAAEQATLCNAAQSQAAKALSKQDQCKLMGIGIGLFATLGDTNAPVTVARSACKSFYDMCMAGPPMTPDANDVAACSSSIASCSATVGEIETCVTDTTQGMKKAAAAVPSCAEMTLTDTAEPETEESAACKALATQCPEVADEILSTNIDLN